MSKIMLRCLIGVLAIHACVLGDEIDNANEYIDGLLDNLRNDPVIATKVEPIQVPNIKERHFEGKNIYIKGLSSLQRDDACKVVPKEGENVVIEVHLKATNIKFKLDYKAKGGAIPIHVHGKANGKLDKVQIFAVVSVSAYDGIGKVEKFKVTKFGRFRVTKSRGATFLFNWLMRIIADNMLRRSKHMVVEGIEKGISELLQEKLSEMKISPRRFNRQ